MSACFQQWTQTFICTCVEMEHPCLLGDNFSAASKKVSCLALMRMQPLCDSWDRTRGTWASGQAALHGPDSCCRQVFQVYDSLHILPLVFIQFLKKMNWFCDPEAGHGLAMCLSRCLRWWSPSFWCILSWCQHCWASTGPHKQRWCFLGNTPHNVLFYRLSLSGDLVWKSVENASFCVQLFWASECH